MEQQTGKVHIVWISRLQDPNAIHVSILVERAATDPRTRAWGSLIVLLRHHQPNRMDCWGQTGRL